MSGYSFWETRLGINLAEVLIHNLPKLAKERKQITEEVSGNNLKDRIDRVLEKGFSVDHVVPLQNNKFLVIYSRNK